MNETFLNIGALQVQRKEAKIELFESFDFIYQKTEDLQTFSIKLRVDPKTFQGFWAFFFGKATEAISQKIKFKWIGWGAEFIQPLELQKKKLVGITLNWKLNDHLKFLQALNRKINFTPILWFKQLVSRIAFKHASKRGVKIDLFFVIEMKLLT